MCVENRFTLSRILELSNNAETVVLEASLPEAVLPVLEASSFLKTTYVIEATLFLATLFKEAFS